MMIYTARLRWREVGALLSLTAAFALCLLGGATAAQPVSAQEGYEAYLAELGWQVSGPPRREEVTLPPAFGPELADFLALQQEGGFDLAAHAGETVERLSYSIANDPWDSGGLLAELLVHDGAVIGGCLRTARLDGFMLPLKAAE